ncbi:hypothetical protein SASPL_115318 [Salvia splendens]|uniref:Aminopeptidase P N-terminal domain-containing protein n=1 Tax=Salvia splendens TaxID=180675 RepID=A0A8X8Y7B3_SALSN|nr:hypothetical protein SASPL_115318 [Salvia splendens]
MMTDVVPYTFRQDADYLYVTGCQQPGGIAVLGHNCGLCMFMPETTPQDVTWQGETAGVDAALSTFKADEAYPISALNKDQSMFFKLRWLDILDRILSSWIECSFQLFHNVNTANSTYVNLESFQKAISNGKVKDFAVHTHEARWIKSEAELKLMRNSASIASQALLQTMLHSKIFPNEEMLSAKFEYECRMRGAQRMAFNPVVGGGSNGSIIHYARNDQRIQDGDLVLMDVGCELHGYTSDITRTWPPCGRFSPAQAELYDLILDTNEECLRLCRPGTTIREIHNYSVDKLRKGFQELGILKSDQPHAYHMLNPTSIGHYLGMDVHDCRTITYDRPLKPGVVLVCKLSYSNSLCIGSWAWDGDSFDYSLLSCVAAEWTAGTFPVITIEPGVYIPSNSNVPERYQGIGIRIEDDVLITESGYEVKFEWLLKLYALHHIVLTASVPKDIKHLESLLNNLSYGMGMEKHNAV